MFAVTTEGNERACSRDELHTAPSTITVERARNEFELFPKSAALPTEEYVAELKRFFLDYLIQTGRIYMGGAFTPPILHIPSSFNQERRLFDVFKISHEATRSTSFVSRAFLYVVYLFHSNDYTQHEKKQEKDNILQLLHSSDPVLVHMFDKNGIDLVRLETELGVQQQKLNDVYIQYGAVTRECICGDMNTTLKINKQAIEKLHLFLGGSFERRFLLVLPVALINQSKEYFDKFKDALELTFDGVARNLAKNSYFKWAGFLIKLPIVIGVFFATVSYSFKSKREQTFSEVYRATWRRILDTLKIHDAHYIPLTTLSPAEIRDMDHSNSVCYHSSCVEYSQNNMLIDDKPVQSVQSVPISPHSLSLTGDAQQHQPVQDGYESDRSSTPVDERAALPLSLDTFDSSVDLDHLDFDLSSTLLSPHPVRQHRINPSTPNKSKYPYEPDSPICSDHDDETPALTYARLRDHKRRSALNRTVLSSKRICLTTTIASAIEDVPYEDQIGYFK